MKQLKAILKESAIPGVVTKTIWGISLSGRGRPRTVHVGGKNHD